MEPVNIRNVITADLDACFAVETACFPPSEAAERETIALRIDRFPQGFLVAEAEGQVVGMLNSGCTNKEDISNEELKKLIGHDDGGNNLVVFALAVLPAWQKRGIAKQLMLRFFGEAQRNAKKKILLICKQELVGYYESLGFVHLGISKSRHGGSTWHEMSFSLRLIDSLTH